VQAGTQKNAISIYPLLRIGKMTPYFDGFLGHFSSITASDKKEHTKCQIYFFIKPQFQMVLSDAMLEGGLFTQRTEILKGNKTNGCTYGEIEHKVYSVSFGLVTVIDHFSLSFTQTNTSMLIKQTYMHEYGNISLSFGL
jgi:lipid A 3-O-deacylase